MIAARETREGRGDGRAIVTPLPPDAPPATFGAAQPGQGAEPPEVLVVHEDGSLEGSLGDDEADAALVGAARDALAHGVSRTIEVAGRQLFVEAYPVRPRLVVVGAVEVARTLVRLAKELGYETVVIDGRAAFATEARFPDVDRLLVGWPDELADEIGLGPADAVAVLTHDVKFDEPAIVEALRRGCRYVGRRRVAQDAGRPPRPAARGRRRGRRSRPAPGPDRARPRRPAAVRDGARDHGRGRRGTASRLGTPDARAGPGARGPGVAAGRRDEGRGRRARGRRRLPVRRRQAARRRSTAGPSIRHVIDAARRGRPRPDRGRGAARRRARGRRSRARRARSPTRRRRRACRARSASACARSRSTPLDAAVILPGDQPRVRAEVIATLIAAAETRPEAAFVVPRYRDDAAPNPILARRSIWRLADELAGDRGFGPVLAAHPELVEHVPVEGANPDVDTRRGPRSAPGRIVTRDVA